MKTFYSVGVAAIIIGWFSFVYFYVYVPQVEAPASAPRAPRVDVVTTTPVLKSYKDATYRIEGVETTLVDGVSETSAAPGSAETITTTYFGNEAKTDLNADGNEDVVFLLTRSTGGTGVFYYLVAALKADNGYVGSGAYFIGDRIAPQTTTVENGVIVVNYADRKEGATFADIPTEGKTLKLSFDTITLQFVPQATQ